MTNQKSTKKAFLSSLLSLVLCMAMLVGTTFAWFTDSVTSTGNIIQSGNLKVDLLVKDKADEEYKSIKESKKAIFDYDLWEPGYVQYENVQVKNVGTLAFKYMMKVVATGEVSILADVIDVYFINSEVTPTRESLATMQPVGTLRDVLESKDADGYLHGVLFADDNAEGGNDEAKATIALKMRESAGNEYQDLSIGSKFDIKLLATQYTYENDSFNDQYDATASYLPAWDGVTLTEPVKDADGVYHITNGAELAYINTILARETGEDVGIKVVLDNDINLGNESWSPIGTEGKPFRGSFDGQGYTIYNVNVTTSGNAGEVGDAGLFGVAQQFSTIKNLTLNNVTVNLANGERVGALVGKTMNLNIESCHVFNASVIGKNKVGSIIGDLVSASMTKCTATNVTVTGEDRAGGLAGRVREETGTASITNNTVKDATITVTAADSANYFVGQNLVNADESTNKYENVKLVKPEKDENTKVTVTAEDVATMSFEQDNTTYVFSGEFDNLTIATSGNLNQVFDGKNATVLGTVTINAPGVAHAYDNLKDAERSGSVTIANFNANVLNVLAYNNSTVDIKNNTVKAMSVIGGNFALNISENNVDGDFGTYNDGENSTNQYGISLRICDYEVSITNNTVTDTYSHAIGINGRRNESNVSWGTKSAINAFKGNNITVNSTQKTGRAALKIWDDVTYAQNDDTVVAAAQTLVNTILADSTNVFIIGDSHCIFDIYGNQINNRF